MKKKIQKESAEKKNNDMRNLVVWLYSFLL